MQSAAKWIDASFHNGVGGIRVVHYADDALAMNALDTGLSVADIMQRSRVGFGTSGARGLVADMTASVCYAYTRGFLQYLKQAGMLAIGSRVALAGDLRPSTPAIMAACASAVIDTGHEPVNCGLIPSPALAYYGLTESIPSLMVTGSHIPDDRNGIKFNRSDGEISKKDEEGIRAQSVMVRDFSFADAVADLPLPEPAARMRYLRRYLDFLPADCLSGMAIGVYEHSGVARDLLAELLEGLGAEVMRLGRSDRFVPVDTEAKRAEDVLLAREWAYEHDLHAIVSTDGDADRPLIADEQGEWLRGDIVGVLCARYLGVSHIVTPVSSNTLVERSGWFEQVDRTRIGSPYVIAGMRAAEASGRIVAGYEANGGVLLATSIVRDGHVLGALPTRDAVIGILCVLLAACERKCLVSALVADLPSRHTASNRLQDAPSDVWMSRLQALASDPGSLRMVFGPVCGDLSSVDTTDGLRVTFANGEIVHLRPSGNAPELRCYNEAGSRMRAGEINQSCMNILSNWH